MRSPFSKSTLIRMMSFWPPFVGAGIRLKRCTADFREIDVEIKLYFWNQNYVKTHFGGSLYAITDPFYMLMLMENLGREYIVWDKAASIRFRKPGKGTVRCSFRLTEEKLNEIRATLLTQDKTEPVFTVNVVAEDGTVIAEVEKVLYVRKKTVKSLTT